MPLDARLELLTPDHPYVGRGGIKLAHALDAFGIQRHRPACARHRRVDRRLHRRAAAARRAPASSRSTSATASSTGGCAPIRASSCARASTRAAWPPTTCRTRVDLVTIDVAFISLRHILPALPPLLARGADVVALVKPQFEAGRDEVGKGGLVTDPAVHEAVIARVTRGGRGRRSRALGHDAVADHRRHRQPGILPAPA